MTSNQKLWGKAVLSTYNYLQRLCDSLDKLVEKTAVNSYCYNNLHSAENSIESISNKIIEYSNRKIDYINLKIIIEKALKDIPKQYAKLLILKYIQKMPIEKASQLLNISRRSSYRQLEQALASFMVTLTKYGYTIEKLELDYSSDPFIKSVLRLIKQNNFLIEEKAEVITNESVFTKYINDLLASAV